jgi:hypothetical protein
MSLITYNGLVVNVGQAVVSQVQRVFSQATAVPKNKQFIVAGAAPLQQLVFSAGQSRTQPPYLICKA